MDFIDGSAFPAPSLWDYLFTRDASASTAQYSIPDQVESMLASMVFCQQVEEIIPEPVPIEGRANLGKIVADSSVNTDFVSLSPTHSNDDELNTEVGSDFISLGSLSTDTNQEKAGGSGYMSLASSDSQTKPPVPTDHSRESASAAASPAIHEEEQNHFYIVNGPLVDIVTMQRPKPPALKSAPETNPGGPSCFSALSHATAIDHCNTVALHSQFYPRKKLKFKDPTDLANTGSASANSCLLSTAKKNPKQTTKRHKRENHSRNVNHLWLTVDEDTYQQLGLIGRRSTLARKSGGPGRPKKKSKKVKSQRCAAFYIIDVDLNTTRVASASAPRRQSTETDTPSRASTKNTPHSVPKAQTSGLQKNKPSTASKSATARSARPPPHSKLWSRLQWALRDRVPPTTLLVVASNGGRSLPIRFPASCKSQRLRVRRTTWASPSPIPIPTCGPGSKTGQPTLDVDEAQLTLQWFGALCCRCLQVLTLIMPSHSHT